MGSEQSTQTGAKTRTRIGQLRRGKSVPEQDRREQDSVESSRPGSCSPGLSVCSDSDLPYISYTVNRPIGDSPKVTGKPGQLIRGKTMGPSSPRKVRKTLNPRTHSVVVVKPAAKEETTETDPDIQRLQKIPSFLPIMRGTLNLPAPRDPEILERLDPNALYRLCHRCEKYMNECAQLVAGDQHLLALQIKEMNRDTTKLLSDLAERQKSFSKYSENLSKITDISAQIDKCHVTLASALDAVETLNNMLPESDKLEPFVWTTG